MSLETQKKAQFEEQSKSKSWWQTIPGILGGVAGIITSTATLVVALSQIGLIGNSTTEDTDQSSSTVQPVEEKQVVEGLPASLEMKAVVVDPDDDYVNIRAKQSLESQIIARVEVGEIVHTIPQSGEWWPVRTQSDRYGYIHKSRIALDE